jgi:hypothetical protein
MQRLLIASSAVVVAHNVSLLQEQLKDVVIEIP